MNFQTLNKQRKFVLIAAVVGVIAFFLPWFSLFGYSASGSDGGFRAWLVFFGFAGAGIVAFLGNQQKTLPATMWFTALLCGAVALLMSIWAWSKAGSLAAFGLYITVLAAAGVIVCAWLFKSPTDTIQGGFDSFKKDIQEKTQNIGKDDSSTTTPS